MDTPQPFPRYSATTLSELYDQLVPSYSSRGWSNGLILSVAHYERRYGLAVAKINPKRAAKRCDSYLIPEDIERAKSRLAEGKEASLRFGLEKTGRGYHGSRGDFCLTSGVIDRRNLTLFYRSLEMIGGFGYDLCLINKLGDLLEIQWKTLTIVAAHANVFALKRNSNEKFYPKLRAIFHAN